MRENSDNEVDFNDSCTDKDGAENVGVRLKERHLGAFLEIEKSYLTNEIII